MVQKRKRGDGKDGMDYSGPSGPIINFGPSTTGKTIRDAIASNPTQGMLDLSRHIHLRASDIPVPITHPVVTTLQRYVETSPNLDEVFAAWAEGHRHRNDKQVETAVKLLRQIIQILGSLPFFRKPVLRIAARLTASGENFSDLLNQLIQSGKRDQALLGLCLAAAAIHIDPVERGSSASGSLAVRIWTRIVEGGSVKVLGKLLGMRKRNKEGAVPYGTGDPLDSPDIRHATLDLIIPLLSSPLFLANSKPLIQPMYSGLVFDPPITIHRFLQGIWTALSHPSAGIARKTALILLDERAVEHVVSLLSHHDIEPVSGQPISEVVLAFLDKATCTPGQGVCFPDRGWYHRETSRNDTDEQAVDSSSSRPSRRVGLHNRLLSNVIRKMGAEAVNDDSRVGEWMVKVLQACPELVEGYWPYSALSLEPRLDTQWIFTVAHVSRIVALPPPIRSTFYQSSRQAIDNEDPTPFPTPPSVVTMIESILPAPLTKAHLSKGLQHSSPLVQNLTALTLARALQKLETVQNLLASVESDLEDPMSSDNPWSQARNELEIEARRRVPDPLVVVAFAQKSATLAAVPEDEDPDPKLVARSAMLTEAALRLLGLYHKNLPSIVNEMRFDVGKLLVSASSVKAERRAKREARAGSLASETGSNISVGTLGTAGMGGGFGQGRGDVDGFDALSQAHVLSLLAAARGWQWINKAAGSQYTYIYHILLLHLSTQHQITQTMTTHLLNQLLLPTLMFEHDSGELEVFLNSLPRTSSTDVEARAQTLTQQIYLLSFLDDCIRRFMKTPYRYIEELLAVVPEYFNISSRGHRMVSPLLMTIMEQLRAKIVGQLISTEAASVILAYLRRIILGLAPKLPDGVFLAALVQALSTTISDAKSKGQDRPGLVETVDGIKGVIADIFPGHESPVGNGETNNVDLVDESSWSFQSPETQILRLAKRSDDRSAQIKIISNRILKQSSSTSSRCGQLALHLLSRYPESTGDLLNVLSATLRATDGDNFEDLKRIIFTSSVIQKLFRAYAESVHRQELDTLARSLAPESIADEVLATGYIHACIEELSSDKKGKKMQEILSAVSPWTSFIAQEQARQLLSIIVRNLKRLSSCSPEIISVLSTILVQAEQPLRVLQNLDEWMKTGLGNAVIAMLNSCDLDGVPRDIDFGQSTIEMSFKGLEADQDPQLVNALVTHFPSALAAFWNHVRSDTSVLINPRIYFTLSRALSIWTPGDIDSKALVKSQLALLSESGMGPLQTAAIHCLVLLADMQPGLIDDTILGATDIKFTLPVATLTQRLATNAKGGQGQGIQRVLHIGLPGIVRSISDGGLGSSEVDDVIGCTIATIQASQEVHLDLDRIEPVIVAVVQDGLDHPLAVELATVLCNASRLKASFIRQQLGLLYSSSVFAKISQSSSSSSGTHVIGLVAAFFKASMYASCQPDFVEPLLNLYGGTLSKTDQQILAIFHTFEKFRHLSVSSLLRLWSSSGTTGSTDGARAFDALTSLDTNQVFQTCCRFPLRRSLNSDKESSAIDDGELYDPVFVLSLLAQTLEEQLSGLDWVELLRSNVLGVAACALAARDDGMRMLGAAVLGKVMECLENVAFHEKAQLLHTLRLLRHTCSPSTNSDNASSRLPGRSPTLTTLFFAHSIRALSTPSHPLYPATSRFLLQRPIVDMWDVPMLFEMLYATMDGHKRDRNWIVRLIRDGTRSEADWSILKRRRTVELLQTLFQSSTDQAFRRLVLEAFSSISLIHSACLSMTLRSGLMQWIQTQWRTMGGAEQGQALEIVENLLVHLIRDETATQVTEKRTRPRNDDWLGALERLISLASTSSDLPRLVTLSRIALRLSPAKSDLAIRLTCRILDRFGGIQTGTDQKTGSARANIVENLFRVGLGLGQVGTQDLGVIKRIRDLARRLETRLGQCIRKEERLARWDEYASSHQI